MVYFKSLLLAAMVMVHGTTAANCDGSDADNLVKQLDQFNSMLLEYANLGGQVIGSGGSIAQKTLARLAEYEVEDIAIPTANHEVSSKSTKGNFVSKVQHQHVESSHTPTVAVQQLHEQSTHQEQKSQPKQNQQSHPHQVQQQVTKQQQQSKTQESSTHTQLPQSNALSKRIQESFVKLNSQQKYLNSLADACIPGSHKLKVASAFTRVFSSYVAQERNLKAAGKLVQMPKSKQKSKNSKVKRQQAGWLTMDNDVNGGFNGNINELTSTTTSTSSSPYADYGYSAEPYMGQPLYQTEYITVTTTSTPPAPPAPASTKGSSAGAASDSNSSGESDSEDESSSTPAAPGPTQITSQHHNIIYRAIDGTYHLITGTIHFVERIFFGGSSLAIEELVAASPKGSKSEDQTDEVAEELRGLISHVARLYNIAE